MVNEKIQLKSGRFLEVQESSFLNRENFKRLLLKELEQININLGDAQQLFERSVNSEMINTLKNLICKLLGSKEIEEFLFTNLFKTCLYNNKKIDYDLFDSDAGAEEDYLFICWEVIRRNLPKYLLKLNMSSLTNKIQNNINIQKSKLMNVQNL